MPAVTDEDEGPWANCEVPLCGQYFRPTRHSCVETAKYVAKNECLSDNIHAKERGTHLLTISTYIEFHTPKADLHTYSSVGVYLDVTVHKMDNSRMEGGLNSVSIFLNNSVFLFERTTSENTAGVTIELSIAEDVAAVGIDVEGNRKTQDGCSQTPNSLALSCSPPSIKIHIHIRNGTPTRPQPLCVDRW
ncbi:hypothetical protein CPC08DRAFT_807463 [Agrocybe pediades]|nr:hypothetical protein CPC08DRAFT_807463 [Agrocybe pediades]